jgi:hypothetical protein
VSSEGQMLVLRARLGMHNSKDLEACVSVNEAQTNTGLAYSARRAGEFVKAKDSTVTIYCDHYIGNNFRKIRNNAVLTCYIWNRQKMQAELSAFEIKVVDYWHWKWHFWD